MHPFRLGLLLGLVVSVTVSCGGDEPSPVGPTPPPRTGTLTLSGKVSETAPTAFRPIAGATIMIMDGPNGGQSTKSDARGAFQLTGLQAGDISIWTAAANYVEHVQRITFTTDLPIAFELDPVFKEVTSTESDSISASACPGYWDVPIERNPCHVRYSFDVHHDGVLTADVTSTDPETSFTVHLFRAVDGQPKGSGVQAWEPTAVSAHTQYIVQVTKFESGGGPPPMRVASFTLTMKRPN